MRLVLAELPVTACINDQTWAGIIDGDGVRHIGGHWFFLVRAISPQGLADANVLLCYFDEVTIRCA
jgi:hypothetical protein